MVYFDVGQIRKTTEYYRLLSKMNHLLSHLIENKIKLYF